MFKIEEKDEELFVKEFPIFQWLGYFCFFCIFIFSLDSLISLYVNFALSSFVKALFIISFAGVLTYIILPTTKVYINRRKKTLIVFKQNLLKSEFEMCFFKNIKDLIFVRETKGAKDNDYYQLILPLKNGEELEISISGRTKKDKYVETADLLNKYIFDDFGEPEPIPYRLTLFHDE